MKWISPYFLLVTTVSCLTFASPLNNTTTTCQPCTKPTCPTPPVCKFGFVRPNIDSCGCRGCPICCPIFFACPLIVRICEPGYVRPVSPCYSCPECYPAETL